MTHITITQATQIRKRAEAGEDMAELATAFNITLERAEGISGVKSKAPKKSKAKKDPEAVDAADEFE